jgi:hypothetical protein
MGAADFPGSAKTGRYAAAGADITCGAALAVWATACALIAHNWHWSDASPLWLWNDSTPISETRQTSISTAKKRFARSINLILQNVFV